MAASSLISSMFIAPSPAELNNRS
ncbi:hypothetical protein Tco_1349059, partial [Tanacetum coccineum]